MANVPKRFQPAAVRLVLCILIGCLGMHFFVEDTRLLAVSPSFDPAQMSVQGYDEITHQDDVVILARLPEKFADNGIPAVATWIAPLEKPASFPILVPPKIA